MRVLPLLLLPLIAMADPKQDYARGVLERSRGNDPTGWFDKALEADPGAWPLAAEVAGLRRMGGDIAGASALLREFSTAHPERLEVQLAYADFLRESSPGDDLAAKLAGEALEKTLESHPGELAVIRRLFRSYEERGMREESKKLFDQVAERPGAGPALAAAEMARTLFPGDDAEARARVDAVFEQAMERSPQDPVLARAASEHFRKSGRLPQAVEMLKRHTEAVPTSLKLRVRLGVLLFAAERGDEGEAVLKAVLEIDPRQGLAHQALAKYYRRLDDPDRARPHAVEALKIRGGDADEFVKLADELLEGDEPRQARLLLEKGLFHHAEDPAIAVKLAIATRRDPSTRDKAAWRFREAEALSGTDGPATEPAFQREFAECLIDSGDLEPAADRVRTAIRGYGADEEAELAGAYRRLAAIFQQQGRSEAEIRPLLKRAEALDPEGG
ncbi:tetratricopeptide repeat protein [Haloferula sp. A504]|uniref:tetratricopeptide repeat protein n=1 Tax=Haloferula sp. A504 TaxID=3373601 RepID=UPI0031BE1192|nr:tetratricopeptide repeat protein [Verrucomicrobiaceae bacterium E54]